MTLCPSVDVPTQPCKWSHVCHSQRQALQSEYQAHGPQCDTFMRLGASSRDYELVARSTPPRGSLPRP